MKNFVTATVNTMKAYEGVEEWLHAILAKLLDLNMWSSPPPFPAVYPTGNNHISH